MNRKAAKVICSAVIVLTTIMGNPNAKANSTNYKLTIQDVVRLSGKDRFQTAVQVSQRGWKSGSEVVILSRGDDFPDALCASTLSKKFDAPILLTRKDNIDEYTISEIKRLKAKKVFIIGKENAISKNVEKSIKLLGLDIVRLGGDNRYSTSVEIAKTVGVKNEIALATGDNYADALSFASIAANKNIPILLVNKDSISKEVKEFINQTNPKKIYVIGGENVISQNALVGLSNVERIAGEDRYKTNAEIMKYFSSDIDNKIVFTAIGGPSEKDFADALSASAYAGKLSSYVVLNKKNETIEFEKSIKDNIKPSTIIYAVGGQDVLSDKSIENLKIPAIEDSQEKDLIGDINIRKSLNNNILVRHNDTKVTNIDVSGNIYVDGNRVELRDLKVDGDIYVDPGKDGITHIVNVEAKSIKILSGAKESIHIVNVKANSVEVEAKESVRLVSEGNTNIEKTTVKTSAIVEAKEGNLGQVEIQKSTAENKQVELRGKIDTVVVKEEVVLKSSAEVNNLKIQKEDANIKIDGSFKNIQVENKAKLEIDKNAKIENVVLKAEAEINAAKDASIKNLNIDVKNEKAQIKIQANVEKVNVESKIENLQIKEGSIVKELVA